MDYKLEINEPKKYFSQRDEENFFSVIKSLSAVKDYRPGPGLQRLTLNLNVATIDDVDLKELIALMMRYGIEMRCLASQCNAVNESWFKNRGAYWYQAVFG